MATMPAELPAPKLPFYLNRLFGRVWVGQSLSAIGDGFASVALGLWVMKTTGSMLAMSTVMTVRALVGLAFGALAGGLADRFNRQRLMIACDLIRGLLFIGIAVLMRSSVQANLPWIIVLLGVAALFSNLFNPAIQSSMVQMVGFEHVARAGALMGFSFMIGNVLGPILGGVVVQVAGGFGGMLVNALSFFLSAYFIARAGRIPQPTMQSGRTSFWGQLAEGLRHATRDRLIFSFALLLAPALIFFSTAFTVLLVALLVDVWHATGALYGTLQGMFAAGYALGMVVLMKHGDKLRRRGLTFGLAIGIGGLLMATSGLLQNPYGVMPILLLMGLTLSVGNLMLQIVMQQQVPPELQGRIFGLSGTVASAVSPVALVLAGVLGERFGVGPVTTWSGIGFALVGVLGLLIPVVRRLR